MNDLNLEQEVKLLIRLFSDASQEYVERLRAAGEKDLADEWSYNLSDLLTDVAEVGLLLAKVYTASQEQVPEAMKWFLQDALGFAMHSHGHVTRLKDILEGRPPSWPPETP